MEEGRGCCDSLETGFAFCWLSRYRPHHFVFPCLIRGKGEQLEGGSVGRGGALERE